MFTVWPLRPGALRARRFACTTFAMKVKSRLCFPSP